MQVESRFPLLRILESLNAGDRETFRHCWLQCSLDMQKKAHRGAVDLSKVTQQDGVKTGQDCGPWVRCLVVVLSLLQYSIMCLQRTGGEGQFGGFGPWLSGCGTCQALGIFCQPLIGAEDPLCFVAEVTYGSDPTVSTEPAAARGDVDGA